MEERTITSEESDALKALGDGVPVFAKYHRTRVEAETMEDLLNCALNAMFSEGLGRFGSISFCRLNNPDDFHADINFCPIGRLAERLGYTSAVIGVVDLRTRTYAMDPQRKPTIEELNLLYPSTETILTRLGLRKIGEFHRGIS